jgi:hypothetical protein
VKGLGATLRKSISQVVYEMPIESTNNGAPSTRLDPEAYLRYVLERIVEYPINRINPENARTRVK